MENDKGRAIPNQFVIVTDNGIYFQSHKSIIAWIDNNGKTTLDRNTWDYSQTTGRYRNQFLKEDKLSTQAKIDAGIYLLANLN